MGAMDFCIVISAKGPTPRIFKKVLEVVDLLVAETGLKVGCSLGELTREQAQILSEHEVWIFNTSWNVRRRNRDRFTLESAPVERDH